MAVTRHIEVNRFNEKSELQVDSVRKTVHVVLPNGKLRYAGNHVDRVLRLPLAPSQEVVEVAPPVEAASEAALNAEGGDEKSDKEKRLKK